MMAPSNIDRLHAAQNQGMRLILGVPRGTSAKMMRHELQMLPVEKRVQLMRDKLYRKIRGNTHHPLNITIDRRQRNGWTTEIQECHRLVSRQLEDPTQLEIDNTAPWEQLPYECRIDCTKEGTEPLRCRWCDEDHNSITKHWLHHCPAMMYWQELITARLGEHEGYLDDRETITAIVNSQSSSIRRDYRTFTKCSSSRAKFVNIVN